jgi:death-on-curing protein
MNSLDKPVLLDLHQQLSQMFGGDPSLRAEKLLDGALATVAKSMSATNADLATCAAALAYRLTLARAFVEGNTRLAAAAAELFVQLNEGQLVANDAELADLFDRIAGGNLSQRAVERAFAGWVKAPQTSAGPAADQGGKGSSASMKDTMHEGSAAAAAAQDTAEVEEGMGSE